MNWLAHLFLSDPTPAFRLGGLLPDLVSMAAMAELSPEFQRGIQRHRQIDTFTDAHPVFRRSVQRFAPPFRRFGGVLVDIFYDHFLARDWASYSETPLPDFAAEVYASFDSHCGEIPHEAHPPLREMRTSNWLCSYRELSGISAALSRISLRLRRPIDLAASVPILEEQYGAFQADFADFFPELQTHVRNEVR